jgi:DNA-directed RNA polymerase specialized sigma24 family protein
MFGQTPEISETLEWMLQSRQVGDEILVQTLVHEQYSAVYRFVLSIIDSHEVNRGRNLVEQVISSAVEDPASYPGDLDVQVWLFEKAINFYERDFGMNRSSPYSAHIDQFSSERGSKNWAFMDWFDALPHELRISMVLKYLFHLSDSHIALVMDVPESRIAEHLAGSKSQLGIQHGNQNIEVTDQDVLAALIERWPELEIDQTDEKIVCQRILKGLKKKERRKRQLVILGEAFLAVLVIIFVAGLGDLISMLTPEPTSEIVYETRMVNQIVYITPTPGPTQPPTPFPDKAILYQAVGGETLLEIADKISFNALILEALNNIPADQPLSAGQQIMIGVSESRVIMPTPVSPRSTPESPPSIPAPLSMSSSDEEIYQRILSGNEYWLTLWADALVIQYGPPGYVGDPELRRQQIWIDQPYFNYVLDGENGADVEFIYSAIGGWENLLNTQTGELLSSVGPQELNYRSNLHEMILHSDFQGEFYGEVEVLAMDIIAGREVLVIDWFTDQASLRGSGFESEQEIKLIGRYWVDTHLGIILRAQNYSRNMQNHLFEETIISKIKLNVPIPRRLYDRSQYLQTYFSRDHTGDYVLEPIEMPEKIMVPSKSEEDIQYLSPPPDFDISNSQLTVHWASLSRFNPELGTTIDLFADSYYLGNFEFTDPEQLLCARSSDGYFVAFTSWSQDLEMGYSPLGWFNLNSLPEVHYLNPEIMPYDFAFSPDNRQLAVYGCQRVGDQACGIYIIDLTTGEVRLLSSVEQGAELIWSPDGGEIAIQGSFLRKGKWRVLVFDSSSGSVIYDGPFDWEGFWVAPDSPIHDWGVQYPPLRGSLELCTQPPRSD